MSATKDQPASISLDDKPKPRFRPTSVRYTEEQRDSGAHADAPQPVNTPASPNDATKTNNVRLANIPLNNKKPPPAPPSRTTTTQSNSNPNSRTPSVSDDRVPTVTPIPIIGSRTQKDLNARDSPPPVPANQNSPTAPSNLSDRAPPPRPRSQSGSQLKNSEDGTPQPQPVNDISLRNRDRRSVRPIHMANGGLLRFSIDGTPIDPDAPQTTEADDSNNPRRSELRKSDSSGDFESTGSYIKDGSRRPSFEKAPEPINANQTNDRRKELRSKVQVDRSNWSSLVLSSNPSIKHMKDRIQPHERSHTFAAEYVGKKTPKEELRKDDLLQLILEFFQREGLKNSRKKLEQVSKTKLRTQLIDAETNKLSEYLRNALKETDRIWDYSMEDRLSEVDMEEEPIKEHLYDLGLLSGSIGNQDVDIDIWAEPEEDNIIYTYESKNAPMQIIPGAGSVIPTSPPSSAPTSPNPRGMQPSKSEPVSPMRLSTSTDVPGGLLSQPLDTNKVIKAASLNKLVEKLTAVKDHDMEFQKTFLMTYTSFTTPEQLLKKLEERRLVQTNSERFIAILQDQIGVEKFGSVSRAKTVKEDIKEGLERATVKTLSLRVVNVIQQWVPDSELNDQQIDQVKHFTEKHFRQDEALYKKLLKAFDKKSSAEEKDKNRDPKNYGTLPPEPKVDFKQLFSSNFQLFDCDELEIARQLTLIEFEIYAKIQPSELQNQSWNKPKLRHRAPNVLAMIHRSTIVSDWVAALIVREERLRSRARLLTKMIKVAEQLKKLNNFSGMMAVIAGINNAAVHRLSFTKAEVPKALIASLEEMMLQTSSKQSYRLYRQHIDQVNPPCIPYIGVYLTDLTFIDEANPNLIPSPSGQKMLINFHKRKLVYRVIAKIQQLQYKGYNLTEVVQIRQNLESDCLKEFVMTDKELWSGSNKIEPRGVTDKVQLL